ncbi:cell division protein ZapA [Christensenellaceae bacterium OttesenSCG-928-L17]|nr:cell division protein ZapA [Christensenellaceae bacterium OttesenSCG-928-L17]
MPNVTVHIAGQTLKLRGSEDQEYIQSLAAYLQKNIDEVEQRNPTLSINLCTILASLNVVDEYFKLRQQYEEMDQRINELRQLSAPAVRRNAPKAPVKRPFEEKAPVNS